MLQRQPLRFLFVDDPGAGKMIMAGLLKTELLIRGDLECRLIVAPGSLVEHWQDELAEKFGLNFEILTREQIEASVSGNPLRKNKGWFYGWIWPRAPTSSSPKSRLLQSGIRSYGMKMQEGSVSLQRSNIGESDCPAR